MLKKPYCPNAMAALEEIKYFLIVILLSDAAVLDFWRTTLSYAEETVEYFQPHKEIRS